MTRRTVLHISALAACSVASALACSDDSGEPTDAADAADASDTPADDSAPPDGGDADAEPEDAPAITCPDVTPADVPVMSEESYRTVRIRLQPPDATQFAASFCRYEPPTRLATEVGAADGCRMLYGASPTVPVGTDFDTGDITIEVNGVPVRMSGPLDGLLCTREPLDPVPAIVPGDTIRAWSTGGTDVPAFDLTVAVPETPELTLPAAGDRTLTVCDTWRFGWEPTASPNPLLRLEGYVEDRAYALECAGPAAISAVIPPELTVLWPEVPDHARVVLAARARAESSDDPPVTLIVDYRPLVPDWTFDFVRP